MNEVVWRSRMFQLLECNWPAVIRDVLVSELVDILIDSSLGLLV